MSRCLKCGAPLPLQGDCPTCLQSQPPPRRVPTLLGQELRLDRRSDTHGIDGRPPPSSPPRRPTPARSLPPRPPPRVPSASNPAAAEEFLPPAEQIQARPAALWQRAGATLVDLLLVLAVGAAYLAVAAKVVGLKQPPSQLTGLDALMVHAHALQRVLLPGAALLAVLSALYGAACGWLWNGRTLGRRLFGIRLVDQTGKAPPLGRAAIRAALSVLSFAAFLGGFWWALFDRAGQTLHDKLTSTYVVRPG